MIDTFLKGLEQNKIKFISGDLPLGLWELEGTILKPEAIQTAEKIDISSELEHIELKGELKKDPIEGLIGAGVGALVGARFLGLIGAAGGAIAGHFVMQGRSEVSVTIELKDGRKCIAVMGPAMLESIKSMSRN
jgi:hypothetical protein